MPASVPAHAALALVLCMTLGACGPDQGIREEPGTAAVPGPAMEPSAAFNEGIPLAKGSDAVLLRADLEDQSADCWGARLPSGLAKAPCGHWGAIGPLPAQLAEGGLSRSGSKSLVVTFDRNESWGGVTLSLSADVVNVRAWYNFAEGFDFGQGIKVGRIRSFNRSTEANEIDIIMTVRSSGDADQCGLTDMADLGIFYNGKPAGRDWGHVIAPVRFERGRWYAVEYQVALNAPGARDGSVKIWVDGRIRGARGGLDIRGKTAAAAKLNRIMLGGWYSNSAMGNPCADPVRPSSVFIDDVAVGTDYIGPD